MGFIKEFKDFAVRGNLIDMSVAVVMGGAFGKVTNAFVDGIVMSTIGKLIINVDTKVLQKGIRVGNKIITPEIVVNFANFITQLLDFIIVALAMFLMIKAINAVRKKEDKPIGFPGPSKQEELLMEIRDLLKNQNSETGNQK